MSTITKRNIKKSVYPKAVYPLSVVISIISLAGVLFAATPSPGHPWVEVGDAWWAATGTTAYRTFTFPDASSTVLTTNTAVTISQGGTGSISTSTAMNVFSGLSVKGDMFFHNGSIHEKLGIGANTYVLTASSSQSAGVAWAPIPTVPGGSNSYIQFNDSDLYNGTSTFTFDKNNSTLFLSGEIDILAQTDPSAPATDTLRLYAKKISGRSMLKAKSPYGVDYAYQPSFFQNAIFILMTGSGTSYTTIGNTASSTGTISHVVSQPLGYMANQVTAASASSTAGTFATTSQFYRGTQTGSNGFFFQARLAYVTATTTPYYTFVGFTDGAGMNTVNGDNPSGNHIGFQYSVSRGDTGWKFMTKDGTTQNVSATILPFGVNTVMEIGRAHV